MHSREEIKHELEHALTVLHAHREATDRETGTVLVRELAGIQVKLAGWIPKTRLDGPIGFHAMFGQWVQSTNPEAQLESMTRVICFLMREPGEHQRY